MNLNLFTVYSNGGSDGFDTFVIWNPSHNAAGFNAHSNDGVSGEVRLVILLPVYYSNTSAYLGFLRNSMALQQTNLQINPRTIPKVVDQVKDESDNGLQLFHSLMIIQITKNTWTGAEMQQGYRPK